MSSNKIVGFSMIPVQKELYAVCEWPDGTKLYQVIAIQSLCRKPPLRIDKKGRLTDENERLDEDDVENLYLLADLDNDDRAQWVDAFDIRLLTSDKDYLQKIGKD